MMTVDGGNNGRNSTRSISRKNEFYGGQYFPGGSGNQVPEPMTMALLRLALCGLVGMRRSI